MQGSLRVTDTTYTTNLNLSSGTASQIVKTDANKNLITGTLSKSDVGLGNVENTALSTWQGTANIKTVGTITSGTWQGTTIGASYLPTAATNALGIVKIGTNISVSSGTISVASGSTSTAGIVKLTDSYTSTDGSNATTGKALLAALQTLDGNLNSTTPGAGKTLTAFSQTDGIVNATFGDISITASQAGLGNVSNNANLNSTTGAKGDIIYWSAANTPSHLTNTNSTTKKFLSITSQVPAWTALSNSDVGLGNVTNDAQVKASLGTAQGDMLYWSAASTPARLAKGSANTILTASGTSQNPAWTSTAATITSATSTTANTAAYANLTLGNNANVSTTTAHSEGQIVLYSAATAAHTLKGASTTTAYTSTLPNNTGVLVSLSDGTVKGSSTKPIYVPATGIVTECSTYAGGTKVTFNGADKGASTASFYAPTAGGNSGYILIGAGTTSAPSWNGAMTLSGTAASTWTATFKGKIIGTSNYSYGDTLPTGTQTTGRIFFQTATTEYELPSGGSSGQLLVKTGSTQTAVAWSNTVSSLTVNGTVTANQVYNAVWNDYAECRQSNEIEPGRVITEAHSGIMELATQRLMPACKVISDTYGSLMGKSKTAQTPIAVAGRVLVYPYREREAYHLGDAVCSAPDGTVDIMSREEIRDYPERIIGTVSEIPNYEIWHAGSKEQPTEILVNGRIWIYVR